MTKTPKHLSKPHDDAILIAWGSADIAAWNMPNGDEALFIDGKRIALDPYRHHTPTQLVINLHSVDAATRKRMVTRLLSL